MKNNKLEPRLDLTKTQGSVPGMNAFVEKNITTLVQDVMEVLHRCRVFEENV